MEVSLAPDSKELTHHETLKLLSNVTGENGMMDAKNNDEKQKIKDTRKYRM